MVSARRGKLVHELSLVHYSLRFCLMLRQNAQRAALRAAGQATSGTLAIKVRVWGRGWVKPVKVMVEFGTSSAFRGWFRVYTRFMVLE